MPQIFSSSSTDGETNLCADNISIKQTLSDHTTQFVTLTVEVLYNCRGKFVKILTRLVSSGHIIIKLCLVKS